MSTEKGESLIGNVPGFAMAASEAERFPVPSVQEREGADIPTKEEVTLRLITCFTGLPTHKITTSRRCFLEP